MPLHKAPKGKVRFCYTAKSGNVKFGYAKLPVIVMNEKKVKTLVIKG
jgi:hypothetical protein